MRARTRPSSGSARSGQRRSGSWGRRAKTARPTTRLSTPVSRSRWRWPYSTTRSGGATKRRSRFGQRLHDFITRVLAAENAPRWHILPVEYDPQEEAPPKTARQQKWWQEQLREKLLADLPRGSSHEVQLLHPGTRKGRGIVMTLMRAGNEGGLVCRVPSALEVTVDQGSYIVSTLTREVTETVRSKTRKVGEARERGSRAAQYDNWWPCAGRRDPDRPKKCPGTRRDHGG